MSDSPCFIMNYVIDFLVFGHDAQSTSQYVVSVYAFLLLISIPMPGALFTYLATLNVASQ